MKYSLLKISRFNIALIITALILYSAAFAQENWGPAEDIITESWYDFCIGYGFCQPTVSSNDSLIFFTYICFDSMGIAFSIYENGEWQTPVALPIGIEEEVLSPIYFYDVRDTLLYFSSYDPDGYGSSDIWAIQLINNTWTQPFNLGPVINSAGGEYSPSLPDDDSGLYFARSGTIMYSDKINGQYADPVALPSIINSDLTETDPRISRDGQKLYFNRYGIPYLPDTLMVSYFSNGAWQHPFALNGYINYNNSPCPMIPASSLGPSFIFDGSKMYFSRFEVWGDFCDPVFGIRASDLMTEIDEDLPLPPSNFSLSAYPNPFNNQTNISIDGNLESVSEIAIYDITGRRIKTYAPTPQITWDGTDSRGAPVSSGIYFVKVGAGDIEKSLRITLLK